MLATALSGGTAMADNQDRRAPIRCTSGELKQQLNDTQLATLHTLERFGWELKFIRRTPQRVAVLFDPDAKKYAVLDEHGNLDENPVFQRFRSP